MWGGSSRQCARLCGVKGGIVALTSIALPLAWGPGIAQCHRAGLGERAHGRGGKAALQTISPPIPLGRWAEPEIAGDRRTLSRRGAQQ